MTNPSESAILIALLLPRGFFADFSQKSKNRFSQVYYEKRNSEASLTRRFSGDRIGSVLSYYENENEEYKEKSEVSEKLFKITLIAGAAMMGCLVLMLIVPCYVTIALYSVSTLTTVVTGLLSNFTNKDGSHGSNKFMQ